MKIAIITSTIGMDDSPIVDPTNNYSNPEQIDYFAFVDKIYPCKVWKQIFLPKFSLIDGYFQNRRNAKLPKILGFCLVPGYDYYIWHDSHSEVYVHPEYILKNILKEKSIALFRHAERNCAYKEIDIIAERRWETQENLDNTKSFLQSNNFQYEQGLFELSSFMYRNCFQVQAMMFSWWEVICKYSSRDQISFPYILQKHNIPYNIIPGAALGYAGNNELIPQVRVVKMKKGI